MPTARTPNAHWDYGDPAHDELWWRRRSLQYDLQERARQRQQDELDAVQRRLQRQQDEAVASCVR